MLDLSELPRPVIRYGAGLWRRRWVILGVAWLAALVGWFGVWLLPDRYESQAHVFIQEAMVDPLLKDVAVRPDYERRVEVMRLSLLTFPNVEEMVYRAGLDATIEAVSALDRQAQLERLVKGVADGIRIDSPRDMYFIISYSNIDAEVARNVVDAAVNLLIEQDLGASLRESESSEQRLVTTIREYDDLLAEQEREIAQYRRLHATELATTRIDDSERSRKQTELNGIIDNISGVRLRIETLKARLAVTPRVSTGGELDTLKVQLAQLRSQYNDSYPDIQNILQQIRQLESENALPDNPDYKRLNAELQNAEDTLRALQVREERVRTEIETQAVTSGQAPTVVAELQRLQRDYEQTQNIHTQLIASRDALALRKTLDNGGQGLDYTVFERPRTALVPNDPPRLLFILAVVVLAFGAGGFIALVLTFIERTYTQSVDLEEAFGLPVVGAIGHVSTRRSRRAARFDFLRLTVAFSALFLLCFFYIYVAVLHPQANLLKGSDEREVIASKEERQ